jgi:hypothetical protein
MESVPFKSQNQLEGVVEMVGVLGLKSRPSAGGEAFLGRSILIMMRIMRKNLTTRPKSTTILP